MEQKEDKLQIVSKKLNDKVGSVLSETSLEGFEKAHLISTAFVALEQMLTDEYMVPIMALQGSKLGFRTDKDKSGGYPIKVVRRCLIEAVLYGLQPYGNQFNIIAENMYPTREGLGGALKKIPGLDYNIILQLPQINQAKDGAAVTARIEFCIPGKIVLTTKEIPLPIKMDSYTSLDGIRGKAERKARKWLYEHLTGLDIGDTDIDDQDAQVISTKPLKMSKHEEEVARLTECIENVENLKDLIGYELHVNTYGLQDIFEKRKAELSK